VAGLTPEASEQLRAVAMLRWRLVVNSLRSVRGRLNLVSRLIAGLLVTAAALGGAFALGGAAWGLISAGKLEWLAAFFWIVFLFWQFFPVMATAFTENVDTSALLRFPLSYRTYFLVRMVMGMLDIPTALGIFWSLGLLVGLSAGEPRLIFWASIAVFGFIFFNLLLSRTVFVWIEHWLSRRRSREIMGLLFFVMIIGFQFIGPAIDHYSKGSPSQRFRYVAKLAPVQRVLPPGLCAEMLTGMEKGSPQRALGGLGLLIAYSGVALGLLHLRLRQQYRGENPEGNARGSAAAPTNDGLRRGWKLPLVSASVSAVFEKELRYFSRSGPMLFTMIMPLVVVLLVMSGKKGFLAHQSEFFFPIGAGYCLLILTNVVYNSFGGDGAGIQCMLMSPVSFRQIVFAKNLAQFAVLVTEVVILLLGVSLINRPPSLVFLALTLCWYLFAAPVNFSVGNLLSLYSPKRIDYAVFGRQRASESTIFASLGVQIAIMGIGALAIFLGYHYSNYWLGVLILAVLAIPSIAGYVILLRRIDGIVMTRREVLATELCKA
jgi:ABC-2 type transport system permease protein